VFLEQFLAAWKAGEGGALPHFASMAALRQFPSDASGYTSARGAWDDTCLQGSSGAGGCDIVLRTAAGQDVTYTALYRTLDAAGDLAIEEFDESW
jgi:hypothetical protein